MFNRLTSTVARALVGTTGMALCAGLCLVGATAPAHAETPAQSDIAVRSQVVSFADLDLGSRAGQRTLERRIRLAARAVCSTDSTVDTARLAEHRCIDDAVAAARLKAASVPLRTAAL